MFSFDAATWLIILWLFAVGGAVGSFLNVVVYRLPQGISLVYPPSHCPKCGKPIRWFDNVPIFGWIMLRGRCRQCHNPISIRYPVVEAITATMFGLLAVVEFALARTSFPYIIYPYHLLLLCTLLCASLIELDGNRPPLRLFVPALVMGVVAPLLWPALRLMPAWEVSPVWLQGAVDGLAGLALAASLCGIVWLIRGNQRPIGVLLSLICVGLFLGWQTLGMIATCSAVFELAMWVPDPVSRRRRIPATISLSIITLIFILSLASLILS